MSKAQKIARLKEIIRELIKKNLAEVSTTATAGIDGTGTGHYDTPKAFASSASGSQGGHPNPEVVGYKKVNEDVINEFVSVDNFNKDFNTAMNLVMKQAKNLKGPLAKHPIKRNINKLKAAQKLFNKFIAPVLVKKDRSLGKGFDLTRIKKELADGKFKSVVQYLIMPQIGGQSYDSNSFFMLDDKEKKLLDRIWSELKKLTNIMDDAQLESVNEVTDKEVNALKKFIRDFDKMQKQYWNIAKMGDQEMKNPKYNKHYETILAAQKSIVDLTRTMQGLKSMGEGLNEGRYHNWRNDESMTPKQKIGISVREVRDALTELDKRIKMNLQLKTELNMDGSAYWKNTHKALTKISERLVKLAGKVGNLK